MEYTRDDADARSPKRQALTPSAAQAVAALDVGIWTTIIEFLPIPKDLKPGEKYISAAERLEYDATVSDVVATWKALLNLRFVSRELATLLHPEDSKALWRVLVLQSFDFSVGISFNVKNFQDDNSVEVPDDEEGEDDGEDEWAEQNPQAVAMRGRYHNMPPNYLVEDLVSWSKLGIYHRPSQYGFLTTLQERPEEGSWSEAEDPFTLFGDLVRLLQFPHGGHMNTGGEGSDPPFKYLGAPVEAGSSSVFYRFHVMQKLGYEPHFWHTGSGIGSEWKWFTEPVALGASLANQCREGRTQGGDMDDASFDDCDEFTFPSCSAGDAKSLRQRIRQHCKDWRSVCCNSNSDGYTPVFFVGESKACPHRWIGYAGLKCWS